MGKLGFCESIYKILVSHISASEVVEKACLAIVKIATDNLNNIERDLVLLVCVTCCPDRQPDIYLILQ